MSSAAVVIGALRLNYNRYFYLDCGPHTIANGNLMGDTVYSGTATVICDTGYKVGGPAYCLISGSWKTPLPTCDPQGQSIIYSYQLAGSLDHDIIANQMHSKSSNLGLPFWRKKADD